MKLAKNYEKYPVLSEPFQAHGYWYIKIDVNGQPTEARLYNDEEYSKMYPPTTISPKDTLGFQNGYIYLILGDTSQFTDWLKIIGARYHKIFHWYLPSTVEIPQIVPNGLRFVKLDWSTVSLNNFLKSDADLNAIMSPYLYGDSVSDFVGHEGERITLLLTVMYAAEVNGKYGPSTLHIFQDKYGNIFQWKTNSKELVVGQTYNVTGTIKRHYVYKGQKRTDLTRCTIS